MINELLHYCERVKKSNNELPMFNELHGHAMYLIQAQPKRFGKVRKVSKIVNNTMGTTRYKYLKQQLSNGKERVSYG